MSRLKKIFQTNRIALKMKNLLNGKTNGHNNKVIPLQQTVIPTLHTPNASQKWYVKNINECL